MPIITLSREMGSLGDDIAIATAERLGLRLVGRELINRAARQAGVPEVALAELDELGLLGVKPSREALDLYRRTVTAAIEELANGGSLLLVGRGGQVVLRDRPGVLHVRIVAPRAMRIHVVQERCQVTAAAAEARVDASDAARAGYLRRHYGVRWDDPHLYDIILNMERLTVATAVDLICLAAARLDEATSPAPQEAAL